MHIKTNSNYVIPKGTTLKINSNQLTLNKDKWIYIDELEIKDDKVIITETKVTCYKYELDINTDLKPLQLEESINTKIMYLCVHGIYMYYIYYAGYGLLITYNLIDYKGHYVDRVHSLDGYKIISKLTI